MAKKSRTPAREPVCVLLADDEPVTRKLFERFLQNGGFEVITAEDGHAALARMTVDVMVAVLDLNMPGMSGLECLQRIREEFPKTEVLIISGVGGPILLQLKLCGLAGLLIASPWWLAEIWGFVLPALHKNERKWSYVFAAIAGPLFLFGVFVGYMTMPKALQVLIGFTPEYVKSLVDFNEYFSFFTRTLIVFGVSFEIPVFVVLLSLAGILSSRQLKQYRAWIILAVFVFAAVATPSTDPFSMLFLAIPMVILMMASEVIARLIDRRRGSRRDLNPDWADDEQSPL